MYNLSNFISTLASVVFATSVFASNETIPLQISIAEWSPHVGDQLLINTKDNWGYLIHDDGIFVRFPVVTGQRRNVWYIGRYYNAATPTWNWEIQSTHIKGDRVTFGQTGRFLRLYKNGQTRTAYGIHSHRDGVQMLSEDDRFRSMGCIIVSEDMLNTIEQAYEFNSGNLSVKTLYGDPFVMLVAEKETKTD